MNRNKKDVKFKFPVIVLGTRYRPSPEPVFVYQEVENNIKDVVNKLQKATVFIQTENWSGSGVLIDKEKGIILTAGHVVGDADYFELTFNDGTYIISGDSYKENKVDVGFIKVNPEKVSHLNELRFASGAEVGDDVYICGCPFGQELAYTVTFGKVAGIERQFGLFGKIYMLQADAQSWPGNSGGPVVDEYGDIIGILVGGVWGFDGISLIVPYNIIQLSLDKYLAELKFEDCQLIFRQ